MNCRNGGGSDGATCATGPEPDHILGGNGSVLAENPPLPQAKTASRERESVARRRLPDRRESTTFAFEAQGLRFTATISRFDDGCLGEVFLTNHKAGSMAGINASDAAVVASIALQYGVPLEVIRHALMRDARGQPSGPLGAALDKIEVQP